MDQKVLIVLGMHRSGTSMLGQWLGACGFNMGEELLGKTPSNKFGRYEDAEFYEFHKKLLKQNRKHYLITGDPKDLKVSPKMKQEAINIVEERKDLPQWGWKEPRTCLFLPLWNELLPDAYALVIYRHYDEVVDSLYRRESNIKRKFRRRDILKRAVEYISYNLKKDYHYNRLLKVWIRYNKDLLDYIKLKDPGKVLIFDVDELLQNDDLIFEKLTGWGFKLTKTPISDIFSESAMKRNFSWNNYDKGLQKEAEDILSELKKIKNSKA